MMRSIESSTEFIAAHEELADLVLVRDLDSAQALLVKHLRSTLDVVYPASRGE